MSFSVYFTFGKKDSFDLELPIKIYGRYSDEYHCLS